MVRLSRIAPEIPVSDLRESLTYYQDKLGFRVAMHLPDREYAVVERDDIAIHLFEEKSQACSPLGIHIFTEGLEELHAELQQRSASLTQGILRKPGETAIFVCTMLPGTC